MAQSKQASVRTESEAFPGGASPYRDWTAEQREQRLGEIEQQLADLSDAEHQNSTEYSTLQGERALLLFAAERYSEAIEVWDRRLALDSSQAESWYNRGLALERLSSYQPALESYDRVIELEPENHIAWGNRAIILRKLGRDEEAMVAARRAFELNPTDMVDSFFEQLRRRQPQLAFVLNPVQSLVTRLRGG